MLTRRVIASAVCLGTPVSSAQIKRLPWMQHYDFHSSPLPSWSIIQPNPPLRTLCRGYYSTPETENNTQPSSGNPLTKLLARTIQYEGPLSVSSFMRLCLLHPSSGYYTSGNTLPHQSAIFGSKGDFITSPEISQMFGEILGIWIITQWQALSRPSAFQLVELGPGRGTLMADVLRTLAQFPEVWECLKGVEMVEVSPSLQAVQKLSLSEWSTRIHWHEKLDSLLPNAKEAGKDTTPLPTLFIAHEFFDALPIFMFEKTDQGWRELLVDVQRPQDIVARVGDDPAAATSQTPTDLSHVQFQFTLAPKPTKPSMSLTLDSRYALDAYAIGDRIEVCPEAWTWTQHMASILNHHGGAALIMDYGNASSVPKDTLRGIQKHQIVPVLHAPGHVDLSANVDFEALKQVASSLDKPLQVFGPIPQAHFLQDMGIHIRYESLLDTLSDETQKAELTSSLNRLIGGEGDGGAGGLGRGGMGFAYQFMTLRSTKGLTAQVLNSAPHPFPLSS